MCSRRILIFGFIIGLLLGTAGAEAQPGAPTLDQCRVEIEINPSNPVAYYCVFRSVLAHGQIDDAAKMLRRYFRENPTIYRIEMLIGWLDQMRDVPGFDALLADAIDGMERTGDFWGVVYAGVEMAPRLAEEGRMTEAEALLTRSLLAAQQTGDPTMEARVWTAHASLNMFRSDYSQALHLLLKARRIVSPDGPYDIQCWVLDSLGTIYWHLCRYPEAFEVFEMAAGIREKAHDEYWRSLSLYNMALCAVKLRLEGVMEQEQLDALVQRALDQAIHSGHFESKAGLYVLRGTVEGGASGLDLVRRALEISRRQGLISMEVSSLVSIGTILAEMGPQFRQESRVSFSEARRLASEKGRTVLRAEVSAAEARVALLFGTPAEGIEESLVALDAIEQTRTAQVGGAIRAQSFSRWVDVYYRLAGFLLEGIPASVNPDEDRALAFRTVERFRARELLEHMEAPRRVPSNEGVVGKQHAEVLALIAGVQRELSKTGLSPEERHESLAELEVLEEQASALRDRLLRESSTAPGYEKPKIHGIAEIQALLAPDEAMLSFQLWDGENDRRAPLEIGESWLLLITRNRVESFAVPPRREIRGRVKILEGFLTSEDGGGGFGLQASVRLYDDLLKEAIDSLPQSIRTLVIIPDDVLFLCPFAGLREVETSLPVGRRYRISIVPSAAVWVHLKTLSPPRRPSSAALIFANPTIGESVQGEKALRAAGPWREGLRLVPLSHAISEARALERVAGKGTLVLSGEDASEAALKTIPLGSFRIISLVTHAVVDEVQPERSAILLAPGSEAEDGFLQVREIPNLGLEGQVVILSSCRSSGGQVLGGEGAQSLARAFLQAGAGAVLASLWPLEDREAAVMFGDLSRELGRGVSVAEALRRAQAGAIDHGISSATWAGLVILGNGDLVPLKAGRRRSWWWFLVGFVLIFSAGVFLRKKFG